MEESFLSGNQFVVRHLGKRSIGGRGGQDRRRGEPDRGGQFSGLVSLLRRRRGADNRFERPRTLGFEGDFSWASEPRTRPVGRDEFRRDAVCRGDEP